MPVLAILLFLCAVALVSAPKSPFTEHDRAAYLGPDKINFIRPGYQIKILSADIATDATIQIRFRISDAKDQPLDRAGIETPGTISISFIAAYIPKGATQYVSYATRTQTSPITGKSAIQATGENTGTFTKVADGEYTYKFLNKAPAGWDASATHTIGAYGSRNLNEFELGVQYADTLFHFVPNKSAKPEPRDVIATATCNQCHYDMGFHGGSRKSMGLCVLCHTPQSTDPDTGNTVDMPVMTHKIHAGSSLPSVVAGKPYVIIGNAQSVNDYSDIVFPADARNCMKCHEQGKAAQADNVFKPTRAACGACHDNVNFASGTNHLDLPQVSDNQCANCHIKQGELPFDASILGAHTIPRMAPQLSGVILDIMKVTDFVPGKKPTIQFGAHDKNGNGIAIDKLDRISFRIAGSTTDFTTVISEDARKATGSNGVYLWTTVAAIPADAKGTWSITAEGRTLQILLPGTKKEISVRDSAANKFMNVSVDGSKMEARRAIVSTDKCNACHGALAFHGDARNKVENCVFCHNPTAVAGTGATASPIDFKVMIHKIHTGVDLARDYKIGTTSFADVGYPGDRRVCSQCHINNSEQLPLKTNLSKVSTPNEPMNIAMPTTAACGGCHDSVSAASHMFANTNVIGESCAVCHGPNSEQSVNKVHAR